MQVKELSFSSSVLRAFQVEIRGEYQLTRPSLVVPLSKEAIRVSTDQSIVSQLEGRILQQTSLQAQNATVCVLQVLGDNFLYPPANIAEYVRSSWVTARSLFPDLTEYNSRNMYRSEIDKVLKYNLNLWFLDNNTYNRIHNDHTLPELHMGIIGIGTMQKYKEASYDTCYETTYITPGYIHYPYYSLNKKITYPWHAFNAITDCIWMRIETTDD